MVKGTRATPLHPRLAAVSDNALMPNSGHSKLITKAENISLDITYKYMSKLYHYTSIETLYNMLEKSIDTDKETQVRYLNMWAIHIKYLNDEIERELFTSALKRMVCKYAKEYDIPLCNEQLKEFDNLCDVDSYIISLSEHQDDLNMWRGYGENGIGVNIEFDFNPNRSLEIFASKV